MKPAYLIIAHTEFVLLENLVRVFDYLFHIYIETFIYKIFPHAEM